MLDIIKTGLSATEFRHFMVGGVIQSLSENVLSLWVDHMLHVSENDAAWTAMDLYYSYYIIIGVRNMLPRKQTRELLLHQSFFSPKQEANETVRVPEYGWAEIAKLFVKSYPGDSMSLIDPILEHFGDKNSVMFPGSSAMTVLTEIIARHPVKSWERILKYLGPPTTANSFWIEMWLRGDDYFKDTGTLTLVPPKSIWSWIDVDPARRAPYVASFIPKTPFKKDGSVCPRELLVRYGIDKEVQRQLIMNLDTGMVSETMDKKKERFLKLKEEEENGIVAAWIDDYIGLTRRKEKFLKRWEEREYPNQNEPETL